MVLDRAAWLILSCDVQRLHLISKHAHRLSVYVIIPVILFKSRNNAISNFNIRTSTKKHGARNAAGRLRSRHRSRSAGRFVSR